MRTRQVLIGLIAVFWLSGIGAAYGQAAPAIQGPVSALRVDGDRLLVGQGSTLIEARIAGGDLQVVRATDLKRHDLRAIAVSQGITLVLSEDGLTTLDQAGRAVDFVDGGGQRLVLRAGRVYIAALAVGVRVLRVDTAGKLTRLGAFQTLGPAADLAAEGDTWLWAAEGDSGVRLYDTANPNAPKILLWLGDLKPATVVRVSGPRLIAGHGNRLSILDTLNIKSPRLLSSTDLGGEDVYAGDVVVVGSRAFVGRIASGGADALVIDLSRPGAPTTAAQVGANGAGERLALHGDDLFIGSGRQGLRQFRFGLENPALVAAWESVRPFEPCTAALPVLPDPPNLGEVSDSQVTLTWKSGCNAAAYEVRINGTVVATVATPGYTFAPEQDITTWQVTAIDAAGNRTDGPIWLFEANSSGWSAAPRAPSMTLLYAPPPLTIELRSPGGVVAATCAAAIAGLLIIVGSAWVIGTWSERRARSSG